MGVNQYGIAAILIISVVILIRAISSTAFKWPMRENIIQSFC